MSFTNSIYKYSSAGSVNHSGSSAAFAAIAGAIVLHQPNAAGISWAGLLRSAFAPAKPTTPDFPPFTPGKTPGNPIPKLIGYAVGVVVAFLVGYKIFGKDDGKIVLKPGAGSPAVKPEPKSPDECFKHLSDAISREHKEHTGDDFGEEFSTFDEFHEFNQRQAGYIDEDYTARDYEDLLCDLICDQNLPKECLATIVDQLNDSMRRANELDKHAPKFTDKDKISIDRINACIRDRCPNKDGDPTGVPRVGDSRHFNN